MNFGYPLVAGIGRYDITPQIGTAFGMWVTQKHPLAQSVHRKILITALSLGTDTDNLMIVSIDLSVLSAPIVSSIKRRIASDTNIPEERIWILLTHTHAGPMCYEEYEGPQADVSRAYLEELPAHAANAARHALDSRRPVRVSAAVGRSNIGINRDYRLKSGRYIIGPNDAGPIDKDVGVLRIDNEGGSAYGCVFIYGCHPTVLGPDNTAVSPEFPGVARDIVEEMTGCQAIFLQGAAGNVGPRKQFCDTIDKVEEVGRELGCEVVKTFFELDSQGKYELDHVLESGAPLGIMKEVRIDTEQHVSFRILTRPVSLDVNNPLGSGVFNVESTLRDARRNVEEHIRLHGRGSPELRRLEQVVARNLFLKHRAARYMAERTYKVQLAGFAAGSLAFLCCGMEPYAEISRAIKDASPFRTTLFAAYEGPDFTYLVPKSYYVNDPPMQVRYSPFSADSADVLIREAGQLLASLAAEVPLP